MGNSLQCSLDNDKDDEHEQYTNVWGALATTLIIYGSLGIMLLLTFEAARSNGKVFASKVYLGLGYRVPELLPPRGCFRWLMPLVAIGNDEVVKTVDQVGLDGYVVLSFLWLCLRVSTAAMLWGFVVLIPIYATSGRDTGSSFGQITMGAVHNGSPRLWASVASTFLLTLGTLKLMDDDWDTFVRLRIRFMGRGDVDIPGGRQQSHSVRVESLPRHLRTDFALAKYFDDLKLEVHSASVNVLLSNELQKSMQTAEWTRERLEAALQHRSLLCKRSQEAADGRAHGDLSTTKSSTRCCRLLQTEDKSATSTRSLELEPKMTIHSCCPGHQPCENDSTIDSRCCTTTYLAVPYFARALDAQNIRFLAAQDAVLVAKAELEDKARADLSARWRNGEEIMSSSGYVTFTSKRSRSDAMQVCLSHERCRAEVFEAPDPRSVIFENSTINEGDMRLRAFVVSIVIKVFALFIFIPLLVFCNVFGDLERLSKVPGLSFVGDLEPGSFAYDFITGQVPAIMQSIVLALLPPIFQIVSLRVERLKTLSDVEASVLDRGFGYQLVNIYFTLLGNSLASTMTVCALFFMCILFLYS